MSEKSNHKKLIVFDFNLDWKQENELNEKHPDLPLIYKLMKKAVEFQTLVLTTSGCFFDAVDFLTKKGINKGYLVANGGAIVYDIGNKKIIAKHFIDKIEVKTLFHHAYTMGLNVIFATTTNKYIFVSNSIIYNKIKDKVYSPFVELSKYSQLTELLDAHDILDLSLQSPDKSSSELLDSLQLYNTIRYFDNENTNFIVKVNKTSNFVHIGNVESTKYRAIQTVMNHAEIDAQNDVLYIPSTCCNRECYISFKNCLIANEPKFKFELGEWKPEKNLSISYNKIDPKLGLESDKFWK